MNYRTNENNSRTENRTKDITTDINKETEKGRANNKCKINRNTQK